MGAFYTETVLTGIPACFGSVKAFSVCSVLQWVLPACHPRQKLFVRGQF